VAVKRNEIFDQWQAADVRPSMGIAFRMDDAVERLYHTWLKAGGAPGVVAIENDAQGRERFIVPTAAPELE
jgi:hypothetical protein